VSYFKRLPLSKGHEHTIYNIYEYILYIERYIYVVLFWFFLMVLVFKLRSWCLLSGLSTSWAMPTTRFTLVVFQIGSCTFPWTSNHDPPTSASWVARIIYKHVPSLQLPFYISLTCLFFIFRALIYQNLFFVNGMRRVIAFFSLLRDNSVETVLAVTS
jgi:hypothetical protein